MGKKLQKNNVKILVLFFAPTGRDPEAMIPLTWYLKKIYGYHIIFGSVFEGIYLIDKYKPQVLLLNNTVGARQMVDVANYAYDQGLKVISLMSEGIFNNQTFPLVIWGNNKEKKINWHQLYFWSSRQLEIAKKKLPHLKNTFRLSGSTGIDRYKIYQFSNKKLFLKKYHKQNFTKVITYAGWIFSFFTNPSKSIKKRFPDRNPKFFKQEMRQVRQILLSLIKNNPDILFILKQHPGEKNNHMEIDSEWSGENVLILKNQEPLADIISLSDLYLVYESTSSMEAWALGKIVINILPSENNDFRHNAYLGNATGKNYFQVQKMVNEFYKNSNIKKFTKKKSVRKTITKNNIGSIDGLNSLRTAREISNFIKSNTLVIPSNFSLIGLCWHFVLQNSWLLKIFPRWRNSYILLCYENFSDFYKLKELYYPQIKNHFEQILTNYKPST